jgi:hypothetical protein
MQINPAIRMLQREREKKSLRDPSRLSVHPFYPAHTSVKPTPVGRSVSTSIGSVTSRSGKILGRPDAKSSLLPLRPHLSPRTLGRFRLRLCWSLGLESLLNPQLTPLHLSLGLRPRFLLRFCPSHGTHPLIKLPVNPLPNLRLIPLIITH